MEKLTLQIKNDKIENIGLKVTTHNESEPVDGYVAHNKRRDTHYPKFFNASTKGTNTKFPPKFGTWAAIKIENDDSKFGYDRTFLKTTAENTLIDVSSLNVGDVVEVRTTTKGSASYHIIFEFVGTVSEKSETEITFEY